MHWAASTDICSSPPCGPEWAERSTATHHLGNDSQRGLDPVYVCHLLARGPCSQGHIKSMGTKPAFWPAEGSLAPPQADDNTAWVCPTACSLFPTHQGDTNLCLSVVSLEKTDGDAARYFSHSLPEWGECPSCHLSQDHCLCQSKSRN